MRRIKIMEHISIDGVIEHDDYEYGAWTAAYRSPAGMEAVMEASGNNYDLLLGRHTYDAWAAYWPKNGNTLIGIELNEATKFVATHRPESLEWGPIGDLGTNAIEGIRSIKSTDGPNLILWGSSTLTSVLLDQGLVDEIVLIVYPVLLGRGKRLFSESFDARKFGFVSSKSLPTGVLVNTYRHEGLLQS
jgi:dihydrofolate reductase